MPVAHIAAMPAPMSKKPQSRARNCNDPDAWFEFVIRDDVLQPQRFLLIDALRLFYSKPPNSVNDFMLYLKSSARFVNSARQPISNDLRASRPRDVVPESAGTDGGWEEEDR